MYLISAEGYKNAGVYFLKIRKTDEIWSSMKDVGNGLAVKNISDLEDGDGAQNYLVFQTILKYFTLNSKWITKWKSKGLSTIFSLINAPHKLLKIVTKRTQKC